MIRWHWTVALAVAVSGCLVRTDGEGGPVGAVTGIVLAGPTCPVETSDGTGCDPVPVQGTVEFWDGDERIGEVTIAQDGTFTADVPVGSYTLRVVPAGDSGFPMCQDVPMTVVEDGNPPLSLECDTGIR